jgi:sugar (pentulose or hexulose) kinase
MILRQRDSHPHLADFFRAQLYAAVAVIRMGMDILTEREGVTVTHLNAHGGLFKVPDVAARCLADALHTPVSVSAAAGEGGAWGMALLAAYMKEHQGMALEDWLDACVFGRVDKITSTPDPVRSQGFEAFYAAYQSSLPAQRALT